MISGSFLSIHSLIFLNLLRGPDKNHTFPNFDHLPSSWKKITNKIHPKPRPSHLRPSHWHHRALPHRLHQHQRPRPGGSARISGCRGPAAWQRGGGQEGIPKDGITADLTGWTTQQVPSTSTAPGVPSCHGPGRLLGPGCLGWSKKGIQNGVCVGRSHFDGHRHASEHPVGGLPMMPMSCTTRASKVLCKNLVMSVPCRTSHEQSVKGLRSHQILRMRLLQLLNLAPQTYIISSPFFTNIGYP